MRQRRGSNGAGRRGSAEGEPLLGRGASADADRRLNHEGGFDDDVRREVLVEHAQRVKEEQRFIMGEDKAIWNCRCSSSVFVAVLLWLCTGLFVFLVVSRKSFAGSYEALMNRTDHRGQTGPPTDLKDLPEGCKGAFCQEDGGSEAFGAVLGAHDGVLAFSNCYSQTCISMLENHLEVQIPVAASSPADPEAAGALTKRLSSGMKWQCVEYARRYWIMRGRPQPASFGAVEGAADIWNTLEYVTFLNGSTAPLLKYANGQPIEAGGSPPRVGDLLLYPRDANEKGDAVHFPYGHVAVIVGVDEAAGVVYVAEQNWSSQPWPAPFHNYSRSIPFSVDGAADGGGGRAYRLHDPYHSIQGWARYGAHLD